MVDVETVTHRAGIGGPVITPTSAAQLQAGLYLCRGDGGVDDARVFIYSRATFDGDDPDAPFLCTWDLTGVGGMAAAYSVTPLPDGRVIVGGWTAGLTGVLIEVPADAPLVNGTPPCRVVFTPSSGPIIGVAQTVYGELICALTVLGPNQAHKLSVELVGWPATVSANSVVYDDSPIVSEPLGAADFCADFSQPGLMWSSRYGAGGSAALWDFTGAAGSLAPSVLFTGSNWNGCIGCAMSDNGELVIGNYDDDRVNVLAGPFATGNPAPTRTLRSSNAADRRPAAVFFDARTGDLVVTFYDSATVAVFDPAAFFAGGTQTPIRRFNTGLSSIQMGRLAADIGVRR